MFVLSLPMAVKSRIFNGWLGTYFRLCCTFQLVYECHCWFILLNTTVWHVIADSHCWAQQYGSTHHCILAALGCWFLTNRAKKSGGEIAACLFFIPFVSIGLLQLFVNMAMYSLSQCRMSSFHFHACWVENEVQGREQGRSLERMRKKSSRWVHFPHSLQLLHHTSCHLF